jgi:lipoprotein-anchoring transpeptidase ErfK/SrfK
MPFFQRLSASDFGFHVGYVPNYPASHGCIRMPDHAALKLFTMTRVGDYVEIVP